MASKAATEKWLQDLTNLPTASGREEAVVDWVTQWASRRDDIKLNLDSGGNVHLTQKGRKSRDPVVAVAHMDHPAFVVTAVAGDTATYEFRGGVDDEYFSGARVEVVSRAGGGGTVLSYDPTTSTGLIKIRGEVLEGDILMWRMRKPRNRTGIHSAPACDDLAGCAAALAALDKARQDPSLRHFSVMLTRGEEMGFLGAIHAAKHQTLSPKSRILSIETSPALSDAPVGGGPIIRTGDRMSIFDHVLTNAISLAAAKSGLTHQRKLMDGGACEATAFVAYGYRSAGLCVALSNHHNRGNLTEVQAGGGPATPAYEEISLDDFHGLVDLLILATVAVDESSGVAPVLDRLYETRSHLLN